MKRHGSLSSRLIASLAVAQFVAIVFLVPITEFIVSISGVNASWGTARDDWGEYRLMRLVRESLSRTQDGDVALRPTASLREYVDANPQTHYAIFDPRTKRALPGSSEDLVAALGRLDRIDVSTVKFSIPDDSRGPSRGILRFVRTPLGDFLIALSGYRFSWDDLFEVAKLFLTLHTLVVIAPGILGALVIAWLVVRREFAPLRAAASDIASIDMNSLNRRITTRNAPTEVAPFFDAVNNALSRLDAGVAAQRRFAANAAHELRTPIAIMRAHADNPDDLAFRRDMRRDIRRVQTIVEQLLAAARTSAPHEGETIDLGAFMLTLIADYTPLMIENKRRMEFEPPLKRIEVTVDKWALECVVSNLLGNALRAEPEGGVVQVRILENAAIEVVDHGRGVAPCDRERIFEPFWRLEAKGKGAGLGLAISKSLIESMGGTLSVGETPGGGATFRIVPATDRLHSGSA